MEYIVWFLISFIIIYLFYFVTVILQKKKYEKFKSSNQVMFFVKKYKLDLKKLNISKFIKVISFTNSLIIALIFTFATAITSNYVCILLIGLLTIMPLMLLSYHIVGLYFKKEEK